MSTTFFSEIHYNNTGVEANEGFEVTGPAGQDMSGWSIVVYNGSGGIRATIPLSGVIPNQSGGFGTLAIAHAGLTANQAWALVNSNTLPATVLEFIGIGTGVTANTGPAVGLTSTQMGVTEPNSTLATQSLQRIGTGYDGTSFSWQAPATASFGLLNSGQNMVPNVLNGTTGDDDGTANPALIGTDTVDTINGSTGNDSLQGRQGMDTLNGGDGDDILSGGAGADVMVGGDGDDIYAIDNVGDVVTEVANQGTDEVRTIFNTDLNNAAFANIENLRLQGTAITGTGNAVANVITGNASNNILSGGAGNDTIRGGAGNDTINGDGDNDTLFGDAGTDTITGGAGKDTMSGGTEADTFVFVATDFAGLAAGTADRIRDFSHADGDHIDLSAIAGLHFSANTAFSGTQPEVIAVQMAATGTTPYVMVQIDSDGNGSTDYAIRVDGLLTMAAGDFIL